MHKQDIYKEISKWRVVFKQSELEKQFQVEEVYNRSSKGVLFAAGLAIYSFFQMIFRIIFSDFNQLPTKFYLYYSMLILLCLLYLMVDQLVRFYYTYYHWTYLFILSLIISWSVYDSDFLIFDPKKNFSYGFATAMLICCNIDGGSFLQKVFLFSVLTMFFIISDSLPSGNLNVFIINRTLLPMSLFAVKIYHEEFAKREIFLKKVKLEDVMSIINKQIPTPFIVAKINKKESSMRFISSNLQADKQLGIYNQSTYDTFIENCYIIKQPELQKQQPSTSSTFFAENELISPSVNSEQQAKGKKGTQSQNPCDPNLINQEQINYDQTNTLKYLVRKKVEHLLKKISTPLCAKNENGFSNSNTTSQPPTKTNLPQIIVNKSLSSSNQSPHFAGTGAERVEFQYESSNTNQQKDGPYPQLKDNSLLINNHTYYPLNSKTRRPIEEEEEVDLPVLRQKNSDHLNLLLLNSPSPQISQRESPCNQAHHLLTSKPLNFSTPEFIDDLVLNEVDFCEFNNSFEKQQKTINHSNNYQFIKSSSSSISQLPIDSHASFSPINSAITQPTRPTFNTIYKTSINSFRLSFNQGQGTLPLDPTDTLLNRVNQQTLKPQSINNQQRSERLIAQNEVSHSLQRNQLNLKLFSNLSNQEDTVSNKPSIYNQLKSNPKQRKTKKKLIKPKQQPDDEVRLNVEYNLKNSTSQIPSRYSVRFRLFRTNEIMVVLIVENDNYKNKFYQEKIKNELLSSIRSHQHSLIQRNFTQLNSLLINLSSSQVLHAQSNNHLHRNQQALTELLACLLSMNILHHAFILFNEFIMNTDKVPTALPNDRINVKINLTQLIQSIRATLSCEARVKDKISIISVGTFSITSDTFLLKILLFSILRYFTQHTLQQGPINQKLIVSINEQYQDEEDGKMDYSEERAHNSNEKCICIKVKIPFRENLLRIIQKTDLFVFSFETLLKDEISGIPCLQSAWLLRTSCKLISQLGPFSKLFIDQDVYNESITISFLLYKDLNILSQNSHLKKSPQQEAINPLEVLEETKKDSIIPQFINSCVRKHVKEIPTSKEELDATARLSILGA